MNELDGLREWFPWPVKSPGLPVRIEGWLTGDMKQTIKSQLQESTRLIIEVGAWLGKSAQFILGTNPNVTLVCIDTWLGSPGQFGKPELRRRWGILYEQFLSNLWVHRERVVPVRATSTVGLRALRHFGIRPDLFYIDGSHEAVDVQRDIELSDALNPAAPIVGDDWTWPSVRQGVQSAMESLSEHRSMQHSNTAWTIQ